MIAAGILISWPANPTGRQLGKYESTGHDYEYLQQSMPCKHIHTSTTLHCTSLEGLLDFLNYSASIGGLDFRRGYVLMAVDILLLYD